MNWIISLAVDVLVAGAIVVGALWLAGHVRKLILRTAERDTRMDPTLFAFAASAARIAILAVAAIFVLGQFGIQTTSLVALLATAGLAIGLALQGTLSNLAAGVMLLVFRPFKVGDFITASGHSGTVKAIELFVTELATPDNVQIIIPNGDVWSKAIMNFSAYDKRRVDLTIGVSYGSDLKAAESILRRIIEDDTRIDTSPEPFIKVGALNDSSVDFTVRVWCERGDYLGVKLDLLRGVKDAFDEGGIDIPFPTQTVIRQG